MWLRTSLCERLGIEVPLVQAPIGGGATPALAAAVSEAGALGLLSVTWRSVDESRAVVARTRSLTRRPFGVNLILRWPVEDKIDACLAAGARVISLAWGDAAPHVPRIHAGGGIAFATVGSAEEARRAAEAGVDVLVAQGFEAGGHVWGRVATLALVPRVVDVAGVVPVVAAGGLADGRGLIAALALGAAGAWMGTRFLLAAEADVHPVYRERLRQATEVDTEHTELFDGGWPAAAHRVLRNSTLSRWEAAGRPPAGARPGEGETVARSADGTPIERYASVFPRSDMTGELEAMALYAGQGVGLCGRVAPAAEIVREIVTEARVTLERLSRLSRGPSGPEVDYSP